MRVVVRYLELLLLCFLGQYAYAQRSLVIQDDSLWVINKLYNKANLLVASDPDSARMLFKECKSHYIQKLDTTSVNRVLVALSDLEKAKESYSLSFDYLWEAMSLVESTDNKLQLYLIHDRLGMLYSIFEKSQEALAHKLSTLKLSKDLIQEGKLHAGALLSSYFSIALHYRKTSNFERAISYLDSCKIVDQSINKGKQNNGFIMVELGYIKMILGDYANAESLMNEAIAQFSAGDDHYLVFAYAYLAELKELQRQNNAAIDNYLKCLQTMERINTHVDLRSGILDCLSRLYHEEHNYSKAYTYLRASKSINDSLFNVKGISNQLFQMRNKYNEAIELKNQQLKSNELLLVKKSQSNLQLKIFLSLLLLILSVIVFILIYNLQKKKYLHEKRETALKSLHEKARAKEILDVKNKELTAYTLQLIDKDRVVNELYQYIQTHIPDPKVTNHIKRSISGNNQKMWDEFYLRFIAVNADFYTKLGERFPKLTPTERKYCALIKLRFSSKDMSQLLQVTVESVHITRHRLRKKMGLPRGASLSNFIAEI
ncbi:tetratricopeptide repeat protein [Saccharicrinis fermentans]|uniref:ATP-dependent transcriptional regulator n=1 Tax=Saccharicrinis fermentans DSM 9555 = JCM 21142 TaxID=869213 RepID=W7YKJ9_9BACT|nr:tetratricopeptide repeat protein [Saccharicrinis fermentans]GAF02889.1 ATP-dependent transcriptional regulator [Saccharicrinis fermentans DSM 9555 = JCM 21142]